MKVKKYFKYINNLGIFYGIKLLFFNMISKIFKINNNKFILKIKTKKTGKEYLWIRPFTTDKYLVNNLLLDNGEYDFFYSPEYSCIKNAKVIIDAGACIGIFSRMMNQLDKDALIIAIEPEKNNFNLLKENLKYSSNIICKENGLWNKKCKLIVEHSKTGEWGFTVKESEENVDVEAIRVQDIIKQFKIERIDILKVDIEGAEVEVFDNNADEWLDKVKMCVIEFHERKRPGCSKMIIDKMKKNGFTYKVYEENYIFMNEKYR